MKNTMMLVAIFILLSFSAYGQGKEVARELRKFIEAPVEEDVSSDFINPNVKIRPKTDSTSKSSKKIYSIGGQQVDEMNSVIYKAFKMHPEWKQVVAITDWTGSMYTYLGQVMRLHKRNIEKKLLAHIVMLKDGDDNIRKNKKKEIGKTGGIYYANPNDMQDFLKQVEIAVDNGEGGDAEENDLEAVLAAQLKYPDTKYFILIADNTEIRDIELLNKIKKPVHVILCNGGWVIDYVKVAYHTGGTITTIKDDVDFSDKSKIDAQNIMLNGLKYKIKNEK